MSSDFYTARQVGKNTKNVRRTVAQSDYDGRRRRSRGRPDAITLVNLAVTTITVPAARNRQRPQQPSSAERGCAPLASYSSVHSHPPRPAHEPKTVKNPVRTTKYKSSPRPSDVSDRTTLSTIDQYNLIYCRRHFSNSDARVPTRRGDRRQTPGQEDSVSIRHRDVCPSVWEICWSRVGSDGFRVRCDFPTVRRTTTPPPTTTTANAATTVVNNRGTFRFVAAAKCVTFRTSVAVACVFARACEPATIIIIIIIIMAVVIA